MHIEEVNCQNFYTLRLWVIELFVDSFNCFIHILKIDLNYDWLVNHKCFYIFLKKFELEIDLKFMKLYDL